MTYESSIPEYALQPARAPQMTPAEAVYHTERMIYPTEMKSVVYQFEEDILVPDTKADMREVLFMDAVCDVLPAEKKVIPKTDDLQNLHGVVTIQTIYRPEGESCGPVAITSKVPYQYQWDLKPGTEGEGIFSCQVKAVEHMMINERKFRVKLTLAFSVQLYSQKELIFFHELKDEPLEMKRKTTDLTCLSLVKKDETSIDEYFRTRESERKAESILKQSFAIAENYRQVTTEKVVINGFVFVNLLYAAKDDQGEETLCSHHQRIEFTQFIPIEKEQRGRKWSTVKPSFIGRNLLVVIDPGGESDDGIRFHIKGTIETRVELYETRKHDMVVDAYHREKQFCCKYQKVPFLHLSDGAMTEAAVREVVNLPDGSRAEEAIYCDSRLIDCQGSAEKGKYHIQGKVESVCLWKDHEGQYHTTKELTDFHASADMEHLEKDGKAACLPLMKNSFITLLNEKQLELNYVLMLSCESYTEEELLLLEEAGFTERINEKEYQMMIVTLKKGETLWDLAKRYRTTETRIREINRLEQEPEPGQKLLMIK